MTHKVIFYFEVPASDVTDVIFDKMKEDFNVDYTSLRRSNPARAADPLDPVKCILKFKWGKAPASLYNKGFGPYFIDELKANVLSLPEYINAIPS